MIDKSTILVTYDAGIDKADLLPFGTITNDLPRLSMLFMRVYGDVLDQVAEVRGVVRVSYNEIHPAEEILHSPSPLTAIENAKIYDEINLAAAHAITTGDPRVRIAIIDSGCSTDHNDINCIGGGRFFKAVSHADNAMPMKVRLSDLMEGVGIVMSVGVYTYDANRAKDGSIPMSPATGYSDSTCKNALFTGAIPLGFVSNQNFTFWINEPVDVLIADDEVNHWRHALGRTTMYDGMGHGTACTGIVSDIAPTCTNVVLKLTTDDGAINKVDIIACLDYVANNNFHIVSTSWGGFTDPEKNAAYDALVATGILWTCSAGNGGVKPDMDVATDAYLFPGATPGVFCVGACGNQVAQNTDTGYIDYHPDTLDFSRLTWYTQKHDRVQIVAPGFGWQVHAPLNYCDLYQYYGEYSRNWNARRYTFQRSGGTSWAQPAVAATAGLMMSKILSGYQTTDPAEVTAILRAAVTPIKDTLKSTAKGPVRLANGNPATVGFGAGRLNTGAAVAAI
jgi:hypothetical protein